MFSYYGSKTNLVEFYPKPKMDTIIEPFAGSARYSLRYFEKDVVLVDKYEVVIKIWKYLKQCSPADILSLPRNFKETDHLRDLKWDCEEQLLLMGFLVGCGAEMPRNKVTRRKSTDRPNHVNFQIKRIAENLFKIRHWKIIHGDYRDIVNVPATWFIDPPYQWGGDKYVVGNRHIDFISLAAWCYARMGQTIVCENSKADWMAFHPIAKQRGSRYTTTEVLWTNERSIFENRQQDLFKTA